MTHQHVCQCRCDTCLATDCEGKICAPHDVGRWIIVSPLMAHPVPTDFDTRTAAEEFIGGMPNSRLSVQQVTESENQ